MRHLDRRLFLQSTSLLVAGSYLRPALCGEAVPRPAFADAPAFEPTALLLTWFRDPTTTMTVQWIGAEADGQRPIYFARLDDENWRQQAHTSAPYPLTDKTRFRAELSGLEPDTEYRFRVGVDSQEFRFRTMPAKANNAIHFVSGGDSGIGPHAVQTNHLAAAQSPMFTVIGGDLAYENGRSAEVFLRFLSNYSRDLRDEHGRLVPMLACIGNHEVDGGYDEPRQKAPFFYSIFDGLFVDGGYGCLDFGDYMSLVFLDTGHTTPIGGQQTDWLESTLKARQECQNLFVFNHVPAYPSFRPFDGEKKAGAGTGSGNRQHWVPLFERYQVDAVFEHHDHTYKRTHPLLDGRPNANGVLYLGDGSWGKLRTPATPEQRPYLAVTDEAYHMSVHRIEGKQRYHVALADNGRVVDVCMTSKRSRANSK